MKRNFVKMMSVALLCVATFITSGCSKDDDNLSTQRVEDLIALFTEAGVWDSDRGGLIDYTDVVYLVATEDESEEDVIEYLEEFFAYSFDTSGEKITLADGVSYINIVKSSTEGVYYTVTFSLSGYEQFEMVVIMAEYYNDDNFAMPYKYGLTT